MNIEVLNIKRKKQKCLPNMCTYMCTVNTYMYMYMLNKEAHVHKCNTITQTQQDKF